MKKLKAISILILFACCGTFVTAQTVEQVLSKYLDAMGGKDRLSNVTSLYTESTAEIMGMQTIMKVTVLNGKGYKQELDIGGMIITTCFNDTEGWSVNPMGGGSAESMPEADYSAGKGQIFVGGLFSVFDQGGYQAEVLGNEKVGEADAVKVQITPAGGNPVLYYFDTGTGQLIRSRSESESQGMMVETVVDFSDYREVDGITQPYNTHINVVGMMEMDLVVSKIEVDIPVDPAIFIKP